ncbi:MAG: hypothetical protein ACJ75Q_00610 [Gaiellaceae bacterium]
MRTELDLDPGTPWDSLSAAEKYKHLKHLGVSRAAAAKAKTLFTVRVTLRGLDVIVPTKPARNSARRQLRAGRPRRRTSRNGSRGSPSGGSDDEPDPPLGGPESVTPSRRCGVCGASLASRYSNAATCSSACRQKAYRRRKQRKFQALRLTADLRAHLKRKVDEARREEIERQRERDRELFIDEVAA